MLVDPDSITRAHGMIGHSFKSDGVVPNSQLQVLIYRDVVRFDATEAPEAEKELARELVGSDWYVDWVDTVYPKLHFHSTCHEGLIVFSGKAKLELGGERHGRFYDVGPRDVILIPAGVGHRSIESTEDFLVLGMYPDGQKWDMQYGVKEDFERLSHDVLAVPLPKKDPFFGEGGPLMHFWK